MSEEAPAYRSPRAAEERRDRDERDLEELQRLGILSKARPGLRDKPPIAIAS